jgi:hypothetical protein
MKTAATFFVFPVETVKKREGKADVYVFRTGMERAKASDVLVSRGKAVKVALTKPGKNKAKH